MLGGKLIHCHSVSKWYTNIISFTSIMLNNSIILLYKFSMQYKNDYCTKLLLIMYIVSTIKLKLNAKKARSQYF